ncbi:hypothetical protein CTI12_AA396380 [Artemisia annua]|uniref:Uncharacterized protein n=1 Tax=Artemisia annua TaxID=35608 RepID=A0A2U1MC36_ARTAN|nr:hypothetical protein CTI12_AA396380 [Artemisia annua]
MIHFNFDDRRYWSRITTNEPRSACTEATKLSPKMVQVLQRVRISPIEPDWEAVPNQTVFELLLNIAWLRAYHHVNFLATPKDPLLVIPRENDIQLHHLLTCLMQQ